MPHPRFSSEEIAEKGQALYDRGIRDKLGPGDRGKYLVLDIETGHYEMDTDQLRPQSRGHCSSQFPTACSDLGEV